MGKNYYVVLLCIVTPLSIAIGWAAAESVRFFTEPFVAGFNQGANGQIRLNSDTATFVIWAVFATILFLIGQRVASRVTAKKASDTPNTKENQENQKRLR